MKRLAFILFALLIAAPMLSSGAVLHPAFNVPFLKAALPATGSGPYVPETAYFAGDGQCYVRFDSAIWADGNTFYASFWIKPDAAGVNTTDYLMAGSSDGVRIRLTAGNVILFTCEDDTSTELVNMTSTATITRDGNTWTHVFIRVDRTVDNQGQIAINGSDSTTINVFLSTAEDASPIDLDNGFTSIGSQFGSEDYGGCIADWWMSSGNTYANIVVGDFISGGDPVDLGATGTNPDGTQPAVFLDGSGTGFINNAGSGGNWNKQGTTALDVCSTAP